MGNSNSVAPSRKALDIYLVGADWKVDLWSADGSTQAVSTTIGTVDVDAASIVALPLDLRALGGDAAHELRIHGGGVLKVLHTEALSSDFPVAALTVVNGEVVGEQIEKIISIGAGITRIRIAWG
jgi:hypothetical protein